MAANINRVMLVGNLTRDPELQAPAVRDAPCSSSASPSTPDAGRVGPVDGQAELLRREGLRQPGRDAVRSTSPRAARIGVDGRLDWRDVGGAGRSASAGGRGRRDSRPVPRQSR